MIVGQPSRLPWARASFWQARRLPHERALPTWVQKRTVRRAGLRVASRRGDLLFLMKTVSATDFRTQASAVFDAVERGETVLVLRHGKPIAEIHPVSSRGNRTPAWRKPGPRLVTKGGALSQAILEERS